MLTNDADIRERIGRGGRDRAEAEFDERRAREGDNGRLVHPRDVAALRRALRALIDDTDLRKRMGRAGRERALAEFDEREVCRVVLETYAEHEGALAGRLGAARRGRSGAR